MTTLTFETIWRFSITAWNWDPSILFGCAALMGVYGAAVGLRLCRATVVFASGVLVLGLALVSPLDALGGTYLLSAHMVQHLLLVLAVPPLLLLGISPGFARKVIGRPFMCLGEAVLRQPLMAWLLGIGTLAVWHLPLLYDAALANERVHIVEHLCFLASGVIFWWPIFSPLPERRLSPPVAVPYLMGAGLCSTFLGIIIGYYPHVLYAPYLYPTDAFHLLALLRDQWGLLPKNDQEIAGQLMWVPGSFVYLAATIAAVVSWFSESDDPDRVTSQAVR